jgi:nitroreductase
MDIYDVMRTRRSVRAYRPDPIPDDVLERVLNAAGLAPWGDGASPTPPTRLIVVRDADLKQSLVPLCHNQKFVASAPVVVVACGAECQRYSRGGWMGRYSTIVDVSIAVDHLTLAARAEGLGTCWVGSFNNDGLRALFGLPDQVNVIAVMPLGYPDGDLFVESSDPRRIPLDEFVRWDRWE